MTGKSILDRFAGKPGDGAGLNGVHEDQDGTDDLVSFGWLRGIRDRAPSLELRKKTGNIVAIPYGWIERFEFDPSEGITLRLPGATIRIKGRNLNAEVRPSIRLFEGLTRHRVPWLREADVPTSLAADEKATVIEQIES